MDSDVLEMIATFNVIVRCGRRGMALRGIAGRGWRGEG